MAQGNRRSGYLWELLLQQRPGTELATLGTGTRITIVVSHRAWTLARMDRIHVFDQGRIVESGTFGELVARGGRFTELFTAQLAPPGPP